MNVTQAVGERRSIRQFLDKPVPEELLNSLLEKASRSPSGGNLQPWYIHAVTGDSLTRLKGVMDKAIEANPNGEGGEYNFYPDPMPEKYQARNFKSAGDMYDLLGISRDEELMRAAVKARNWEFFGAPVGLFFSLDNIMASNQWAHIGMYMQTLALLAVSTASAHACRRLGRFTPRPSGLSLTCPMTGCFTVAWPSVMLIRTHPSIRW